MRNVLFNEDWIADFVSLWNDASNKAAWGHLSGMGFVRFGIEEDEDMILRSCALIWDDPGRVTVVQQLSETPEAPSFYAPSHIWESVIYSYYSPIHAVMYKNMRFVGVMRFAMDFSDQFEYVADIATLVNRRFLNI